MIWQILNIYYIFYSICVTDQIVNVSFFKPLQRRERGKQKKEKKRLEKEIQKEEDWRKKGKGEEKREREAQHFTWKKYIWSIAPFFGEMVLTSARE